jgi:excisionase family DNA binding protein
MTSNKTDGNGHGPPPEPTAEDDVPGDLITAKEAAAILRCSKQAVGRYVRTGRLRGWARAGKNLLVSKAEVMALLVPGPPPPRERKKTAEGRRAAEWAAQVLREHGVG